MDDRPFDTKKGAEKMGWQLETIHDSGIVGNESKVIAVKQGSEMRPGI